MTTRAEVGDWYYVCCEQDLYFIEDEDELRQVNGWIAEELHFPEEPGPYPRVFKTREAALAAIKEGK